MQVKTTVKGNTLEAKLTVTKTKSGFVNQTSTDMVFNGAIAMQLKLMLNNSYNGYIYSNIYSLVFLKFRQCQGAVDYFTYIVKFSSKELDLQDKRFASNDDAWHLLYETYDAEQFTGFNLVARMEVVPSKCLFACLHEDTELTDFELRGEDGSVHVHRAVLAAASPVLRRMLGGAWRGITEGHVDVFGTSSATLQHFRNYIYLHSLPDAGLERLLLLAAHYEMTDLEQQCVDKLVRSVAAENACDMIEFAAKHKLTRLLLAVLECVQSGDVSVFDIRNYLAQSSLIHGT